MVWFGLDLVWFGLVFVQFRFRFGVVSDRFVSATLLIRSTLLFFFYVWGLPTVLIRSTLGVSFLQLGAYNTAPSGWFVFDSYGLPNAAHLLDVDWFLTATTETFSAAYSLDVG